MTDRHPLEKATPEELRLRAADIWRRMEAGVMGCRGGASEEALGGMNTRAQVLLLRADLLERLPEPNTNPAGSPAQPN